MARAAKCRGCTDDHIPVLYSNLSRRATKLLLLELENESLKREIAQLKGARHMMRAKMKVSAVKATKYGEVIEAAAVCSDKAYGPNGESEDNTFARFTPSGSLSLTVNNPDLLGKIKPGQKFYVDFTLAE